MSDTPPIFQMNTGISVTKTYSLTMDHIGKVADMAQRLGVSQGDVVRQAIDLLWNKLETQDNGHES